MKTEPQRTCPSCGNELSGAMEFCPVCMLRDALAGGVESGESSFEEAAKPTPVQALQRLDHYELVTGEDGKPVELGRGAMGVTYTAFDINLRCPVTLKVISERYLGDESARLRFLREARAAASVRHPNVASVFHTNGATTGTPEFWKRVAADADDFAKRELMAGSAELAQLAQLESQANAATEKARAKAAELDELFEQFSGLADQANRINARLAALATERESLDLNHLQAAFTDHYVALLSNRTQDRMALDLHSGVIATRELRLSIVSALEGELQAELRQLQGKNKRLAKTLNLKPHDF